MSRSRSVQSLKNASQEVMGQEDKLTILSQLFFVAVTLLESDYEYEFLLAVRLLDKVSISLEQTSSVRLIITSCILS